MNFLILRHLRRLRAMRRRCPEIWSLCRSGTENTRFAPNIAELLSKIDGIVAGVPFRRVITKLEHIKYYFVVYCLINFLIRNFICRLMSVPFSVRF